MLKTHSRASRSELESVPSRRTVNLVILSANQYSSEWRGDKGHAPISTINASPTTLPRSSFVGAGDRPGDKSPGLQDAIFEENDRPVCLPSPVAVGLARLGLWTCGATETSQQDRGSAMEYDTTCHPTRRLFGGIDTSSRVAYAGIDRRCF